MDNVTYNLPSKQGNITIPPGQKIVYNDLELLGRGTSNWGDEFNGNYIKLDDKISDKLSAVINQDIIPDVADTYTLGSLEKPFKDLYVGANSFYVNGQKVISDNSGTIVLSADNDQNIQIKANGGGDIEFYPSGTGNIEMKGTVEIAAGKLLRTSDGSTLTINNSISVDGDVSADSFNGKTIEVNVPADAVFTDTIVDISGKVDKIDVLTATSSSNKIVTQSDISALGSGDMVQSVYDTDGNGIVDKAEDANTVNGFNLEVSVPHDAIFTDTLYGKPASEPISYIAGLQVELDSKLGSESLTTLTYIGNKLRYTDENGGVSEISLSEYIDDTNLARVTSGAIAPDGIATFYRDDATTFTIDMSSFLDDTNLITSVAGKTGSVILVKSDIVDFDDSDYAAASQGIKADTAVQPNSNVSILANDAGYITVADVPTNVSELANDAGYITIAGISGKVDKVTGKGLSTNDYTSAEKTKLTSVEAGATADQTKADIDALGINSATVNGKNVQSDVPANAVFVDTIYDDSTLSSRVATLETADSNHGTYAEFAAAFDAAK
jgi:hypothetical protein